MKENIKEMVKSTGLSTDDIDNYETDWVVENQTGEIIGYSGIERRGNNVYLQSLAVKRNYRGWGIGRKLVEKAFEYMNEAFARLCSTEDAKEGVCAFKEKRTPTWKER